MKKQNITATTVKLSDSLYDEFKILGIRHKLTLQDFVEKCVSLYVSDEPFSSSFRNIINNTATPVYHLTQLATTLSGASNDTTSSGLSTTGSFTLNI